MRVLLVGLMATGKTTVGRRLAALLGGNYVDNDELVLRSGGVALEELHERAGEAGLRAAESAALGAALAAPPPVVCGVAAGVVLDAADRERLRTADGVVVWLRARPETLARRVGPDGGARPWLHPDPLTVLAEMAARRNPLYAEVADLVVDVDDAGPDDLARLIASRIPDCHRGGTPPAR